MDSAGADVSVDSSEGVVTDTFEQRRRRQSLLAIAGVLILVDQITKWWAVKSLTGRTPIEGPLGSSLRLVYNRGSAFSLGESFGPLFAVLAVGVSIALVVMAAQVDRRPVLVGLGLIQGGAIGNVIDRLFRDGDGFLRGGVVDFLEAGSWWPVFNVADIGIVVGGALVVLFGSRD